jgi:hypothetical protein
MGRIVAAVPSPGTVLRKTVPLLCCAIALAICGSRWRRVMAAAPAANRANPYKACHAYEVDGFAKTTMARSMRVGGVELPGVVRTSDATITMSSGQGGSWQTLRSGSTSSRYHVDYVIGSGTHASGYIVDLGDHLFQSPVAYYGSPGAYDLAPGHDGRRGPSIVQEKK